MLAVFDQSIAKAFAFLTDLLGSHHLAAGVGLIVVALLFLGPGFFRRWRWVWLSPLLLFAPFLMDPTSLAFTTKLEFWVAAIFLAMVWWLFLLAMYAWMTWLYRKDPEAFMARIERNRRRSHSCLKTFDGVDEFNPIGGPTIFGLDEYGNYIYPELDDTGHSTTS